MADSTLAALDPHTPVVDADSMYVENGGVAKKVAASVLKTYVSASPTLVTPNIGTPSAGVITACTGAPTLAITNMTGTGTNLTFVNPALGTPASGVLTNCTGAPALSQRAAQAVTATTGGGTTGLITATTEFAAVTTDSINKQVSLPAAIGGKQIHIFVAATGCELISAVAADKVNNVVVGATNEAALVADTLYTCVYDGVNNWRMTGLTALGVVEAPVVPDAL